MGSCFDEDWEGPVDGDWQDDMEPDYYDGDNIVVSNVVNAALDRAETFSLGGGDGESLLDGENDCRRLQYLEECFAAAGTIADNGLMHDDSESNYGSSKVYLSSKLTFHMYNILYA